MSLFFMALVKFEVKQEYGEDDGSKHDVGEVVELDPKAERTLQLAVNGYVREIE